MEIVLVIWLCCGIAGALIAGGKHRSRVGWFLLCIVFGLLALAILACLPNAPIRHE